MAINPYLRYPSNTTAPSSAYPWGEARNVVVDGDGTGTPWREDILNDMWGFFQSIIQNAVGVTPDNNTDEVGASQYYDGMRQCAGWPGLIVPLGLNASPSTFGLRILELVGQTVVIASYSDLVANTYVGNIFNATADSFYKSSDVSGLIPDVNGPYYNLPDMRGRFLRGLDTSALRDTDGLTRILGSYQNTTLIDHEHTVEDSTGTILGDAAIDTLGTTYPMLAYTGITNPGRADNITTDPAVTVRTKDNRPYNLAINFGIWY
jgi:hypothetical protein